MDAINVIAGVMPRERGGRTAGTRGDFQKCWSILEALSRLERGEDFTVVFEHLEDVSFVHGQAVDVYQVKGHDSGRLSVATLIQVKEGRGSILSRLWSTCEDLKSLDASWNVVSNRPLGTTLRSGLPAVELDRIHFCDLNSDDRSRIRRAMRKQGCAVLLSRVAARTHFIRYKLSTADPKRETLGAMGGVLDGFVPGIRAREVAALLDALLSQIGSLSLDEAVPSSADEFLRRRCMSASSIRNAIDEAASCRSSVEEAWVLMYSLLAELLSARDQQECKRSLLTIFSRASNPADAAMQRELSRARGVIWESSLPTKQLCERCARQPQDFGFGSAPEAIAMVIYVSHIDLEVQKAPPQLEVRL